MPRPPGSRPELRRSDDPSLGPPPRGRSGGPVDYWLPTTGPADQPGIDGALTRRSETSAWIHVGVDSVDKAIRGIEEAGGDAVTQKMPIPGIGYMAYCRDPEGNTIGVYEEDPSAA